MYHSLWADGYHLNVRLYEKLLLSIDMLDEGKLTKVSSFFFFFQVMTAPRWKHSDLSEISDFLHIFELVYGFIFALQLHAVSFWF